VKRKVERERIGGREKYVGKASKSAKSKDQQNNMVWEKRTRTRNKQKYDDPITEQVSIRKLSHLAAV